VPTALSMDLVVEQLPSVQRTSFNGKKTKRLGGVFGLLL